MSIRRSVLNLGRYPPSRLIDLARLQEDYGYETFWYANERFFREVYTWCSSLWSCFRSGLWARCLP
jgi:hypothetical protein